MTSGVPDPSTALVRDAVPADLDAVLAIEEASFSQPWGRAEFVELLASRRVAFMVLCGGGGIVLGYAVVYLAGESADLANIAIAPVARGRGLGRHLLESAIVAAHVRGARELYLEVRESNMAARTLYESAGFAAVGRRRRYYDSPVEDAILLRLDLAVYAAAHPADASARRGRS